MKSAAVSDALIAVATAVIETQPPEAQQIIGNILRRAIREGLLEGDARTLVEKFVDEPPPRRRRSRPRAPDIRLPSATHQMLGAASAALGVTESKFTCAAIMLALQYEPIAKAALEVYEGQV